MFLFEKVLSIVPTIDMKMYLYFVKVIYNCVQI